MRYFITFIVVFALSIFFKSGIIQDSNNFNSCDAQRRTIPTKKIVSVHFTDDGMGCVMLSNPVVR